MNNIINKREIQLYEYSITTISHASEFYTLVLQRMHEHARARARAIRHILCVCVLARARTRTHTHTHTHTQHTHTHSQIYQSFQNLCRSQPTF